MRAIKIAAAALVLSGFSVPVQAQDDQVFRNWGSCQNYLNKARRAASRESDPTEAARWDAAFCKLIAWNQAVIIFPI